MSSSHCSPDSATLSISFQKKLKKYAANLRLYSLPQKHCTKFSNEKSSVFSPVNLFENLHESAYDIYNCIYKVKKNAPNGNPEL